ncbi:hypothetical protein HB364_27160 [Pseudoflavitalea sp. X16]|uniref:hypothetical protein n=1 Tax=Paraflavitalea devenefica TaxID=2716334 RepID=UPI001422C740|nr:hypothetical protein [Paraflavitalea devenefica]NII28791.1 hypothetical protein [Paraflavitalea devenefica]
MRLIKSYFYTSHAQRMKQVCKYNYFHLLRPDILESCSFSGSIPVAFLADTSTTPRNAAATITLLFNYYSATVELLFTCLYRGLTRLLPRTNYGIPIPAPSLSLPLL